MTKSVPLNNRVLSTEDYVVAFRVYKSIEFRNSTGKFTRPFSKTTVSDDLKDNKTPGNNCCI